GAHLRFSGSSAPTARRTPAPPARPGAVSWPTGRCRACCRTTGRSRSTSSSSRLAYRTHVRYAVAMKLLQPGRITEVYGSTGMGMTRLGLGLLVETSQRAQVVALDVKGWLSPLAAWEMGVDSSRLVIVRCPDQVLWPLMAASVIDSVQAWYAEVPAGVRDQQLRRLAALARDRRTGVALRHLGDPLLSGAAHLRLWAREVRWEGVDRGHGQLRRRRLVVEASGRGVAGTTRANEMGDDGTGVMPGVSGGGNEGTQRMAR